MQSLRLRSVLPAVLAGSLIVLTPAADPKVHGVGNDSLTAYTEEIDAWRKQREERLRRPDGYLSIVGLFWLEKGRSTFGSDTANDLVFPETVPDFVGSFRLAGGEVTVEIRPGVEVTCDGEVVSTMRLRHDGDERHGPSVLELGSLRWYVIKRGERIGVRLKNRESELLAGFKGLEHFPVEPQWRIEGVLERYQPIRYIPISNVVDVITNEPTPGALVFEAGGKTHRLDAIGEPGDQNLFLIFSDDTNGRETYGGGRFLVVQAPGDDGRVVIDFNKAYNPPCAFSKYTTCPLPPPQNHLPIPVLAGEKAYPEPPR